MSLSNTTLTTLSSAPYEDDYYVPSDADASVLRGEDFDFHRILFRPARAVQARELTQLQTIIQTQIERHGKAAFRNGEAVYGGGLTLDTGATSGKMTAEANLAAFFDRTTNVGKYVMKVTGGVGDPSVRAHVLQFVAADEGVTTDNYLVFKPQAAGTFVAGDTIQVVEDAGTTANFATGDVFSAASTFSIDEGVFFVSGFFVRVRKQTIVLDVATARPNCRIGLEIDEQFIDELDDVIGETLLDPANPGAPGAHRFRVRLTLAKRSLDTSADPNFIELARVIDGVLQRVKQTPRFVRIDELNQILARRTHDESGDYVVRTFSPVIETDPEDSSKFILAVGPGKAYVKGYEVETTEPTKLRLRKGRATAAVDTREISTTVGNYVYAVRLGLGVSPTAYFGNNAIVDIHCANVASINRTSETTYNYSKIGTARVRMVETHEVPNDPLLHANNSVYKLFFYDVDYGAVTGNLVSSSIANNDVNLVLGVAAGVPLVNGALIGTTIVLGGSASPITGTFTVKNYTANATHGVAVLNEMLPTLPNGNTTYRVLYQAKDIDSFAKYDADEIAGAPLVTKLSFQADVDLRSKLTSDSATLGHAGDTIISETNKNTLLYQIPEMFVKANSITTNSAIFTSWGKTSNTSVTGGGTAAVTLTLSGDGADFTLPTGALTAAEASEHLLVFDMSADANGSGRPLQFTTTAGAAQCLTDCVVTDTGSAYSIAFNYRNAPAGTRYLIAYARTTIFGLTHRQKTLMLGNTTATHTSTANSIPNGQIEFHTLDVTPGATYSLKTADVFRVVKVLYKDANTAFANTDLSTATDVTSHFTLDNGQRDNAYEYSQLVVGPRASTVVKPTGRLFVIFDVFLHTGRGYCTIDSYLTNVNIAKGLTYETVPSYTSAKYNRTISLRDVLDFRPVRQTWVDTAFQFASTDVQTSLSYASTDPAGPYWTPVSDEEWIGSYEHYLSRIDNVGLGYDGVFRVIEGTDAVSATRPTDDSGALLLFQLHIPPYTLVNSAGVPESVSLKTFAYKRFTMQDLSKVENRVAHLEYYTALSYLERITRDEAVLDDSGNERFKNGILVDSFHGGDVGDVRRSDFTASIDQLNRELRSGFRTFVVQFAGDMVQGTTANVVTIGDMAIPTYNVVPFITQPLATRAVSVNPFDVASFYGHVKLSPAVDIWKDTSTRPAQTIDMGGPTTEIWAGAETPSFTVWGEWEQTWSGVTDIQMHRTYSTPPGWDPIRHAPGAMTEINFNDVTTSTVYERQGTAYEYVVTPSSQSLGNRVVDVSIVHNMRARDIVFSADGLKPNANLYAFFDGRNVDGYVQRANQLTLTPVTTPTTEPFFVGQTLYVKKALTGNVATTLNTGTVTGTGTHFDFEVAVGEYVRIQQGVNWFDTSITARASNTALTIAPVANATFAAATVYTFTPVTVADVAKRITGANTQFTLKVVRASRDADLDSATPYTIIAGSLRPEKQVKDPGVTTVGASVIVPASPKANSATFTVDAAVCVSGVVRAWNASLHTLQLDTDAPATIDVGTVIRFVAGPGAGSSALATAYDAATQTVTLDSGTPAIVAGQTVYSIASLQADGFIGTDVVIGRAGTVAGVFHLPGGQFATGTRQFRLTDSANNDLDDATTAAELGYQASGLSYVEQETTVTSRSLSLQRLGPQSESMVRDETTTAITSIEYVDPLAETFLVDAKQYPQGVFITSVDVCFAAKPTEDVPVILEIRNVVNGYPSSSQILPCVAADGLAAAALRPDQVNVSPTPSFDSAATFTRFNLPAPVHLMPGREYAIVLRSDSAAYTVYTALLNDVVIGTADSIVSKQPYAGSFFKSQNASTWTAEQNEDMMFRINRAVWTASAAAPFEARLIARAIRPAVDTLLDSFEFYPHDVQVSDVTRIATTLGIRPANGAVAIQYVGVPANEIQPLRGRSKIAAADSVDTTLPLLSTNRSISEVSANSIDVMIDMTTTSPDVAPFVDMKKMNLLGVAHHLNDMPVLESLLNITNRGARYLPTLLTGTVATTATSNVVTGTGTDFVTTLAVGDTVVIGGNVEILVSTVTNATSFIATANVGVTRSANTYYTYGVKGANNAVEFMAESPGATTATGYVTVARNGQLDDIVLVDDGANFIVTPTVAVQVPNTDDADAAFTLTQTQGVITSGSELSPSGGNALTRYITRPVVLAEGFDARDITVTFDAVKPWSTRFHVYYKVLPGDAENARFDDQPWRLMTQETPASTYSMTQNQFKEFKYITPAGRALGEADTTDSFRVFAIKIVMSSTNPTDAPRIANFRAIALDV